MLAFDSRHVSVDKISKAFFTIEGGEKALTCVKALLDLCGNSYCTIDKADKAKYHAAACYASNFVVAVCSQAFELMRECGFDSESAAKALVPLMRENMDNICLRGAKNALTGPIARNDKETVKKHLECIGEKRRPLYMAAGRVLMELSENTDSDLYEILGKDTENENNNSV